MNESQPSEDAPTRPQLSQRVSRTLVRVNNPGNQSGSVDSGLGQGMEMALTLCVFLGLGWLADKALGTSPTMMVVLVVFAMVGQSARMWFTYDARMRTLEQQRREQVAGKSVRDTQTPITLSSEAPSQPEHSPRPENGA